VTRCLFRLLRPVMARTYLSGAPTRMSAGVPTDASFGFIEGPHPLHLLVVGGLSGSAIGVRSFELGVAHQLALQLSRRSSRGVEWESLGGETMRLASSARALRALPGLGSFDVIVVSPGTADILAFVSLRAWRAELRTLLEYLLSTACPGTQVIVTEVPDVSAHVQVGRVASAILRDDAREFTATVDDVCQEFADARSVSLPPVERSDFIDGAFSYSTLYRRWSRHLAELILPRPTAAALE
jgi:hypothetical protein